MPNIQNDQFMGKCDQIHILKLNLKPLNRLSKRSSHFLECQKIKLSFDKVFV